MAKKKNTKMTLHSRYIHVLHSNIIFDCICLSVPHYQALTADPEQKANIIYLRN